MEGYINVDKYDSFSPDIVCDLEVTPWPFETNSVSEIVLRHVLEHLGGELPVFLAMMKEMYRVCAPDARIDITVPHPRSEGFAGDPTHVRPITPTIMSLFSQRLNREWREKGWPNTPLGTYIGVDFEIVQSEFTLTQHWADKFYGGDMNQQEIEFATQTYFNVVDEVRIGLRTVKEP